MWCILVASEHRRARRLTAGVCPSATFIRVTSIVLVKNRSHSSWHNRLRDLGAGYGNLAGSVAFFRQSDRLRMSTLRIIVSAQVVTWSSQICRQAESLDGRFLFVAARHRAIAAARILAVLREL